MGEDFFTNQVNKRFPLKIRLTDVFVLNLKSHACNVFGLIEQAEKRTGSSGETKKTRGVKEDTDSDEPDFWMLKSSSGSESEHEGDEENCKGCSFFVCVLFVGSTFISF